MIPLGAEAQPEISLDDNEALLAEEQRVQIESDASAHNFVDDLDEEARARLAKLVIKTASDDKTSRADWDEKHEQWQRLYAQNDWEQVSVGEWSASESIPLLTEACNMFATRTYKAFFTQDSFVRASPVQYKPDQDLAELKERAERVGRHMAWQLSYGIRSYRQDKNLLFLAAARDGSMFTKTYFDPLKKKTVVGNVRAIDLLVPYTVGPVNIEDVPRLTHICRPTMVQCSELYNSGYYSEMPIEARDLELSPTDDAYDDSEGLSQPPGDSGMALILEQHLYYDLFDTGEIRPYVAMVDKTSGKLLRLSINYNASPTGEVDEKIGYKRIEYFTHYRFLPNPDGFYGYGLGHMLGDINSATNVMLRQILDAATLQNDGNNSGFVSDDLAIDGDDITLELGKFKKVGAGGQDINDKIAMMKFPGPSEALSNVMQWLDQRGQRLGSITEATTGSSTTVQQPTTVITQVEQATELMTSVQLGLADSIGQEFEKIYRLNGKYLPVYDYFVVNGEGQEIARQDYADDLMVEPVFDPRYSSQVQRISLAQAELQAVTQNPLSQTRPQAIDAAFRNYLQALGSENTDEYFPKPPEPMNVDNQLAENGFFTLPPDKRPAFDVFPDQDHEEHLMMLQAFKASPAYAMIAQLGDQETLMAIANHERAHMGYLIVNESGLTDEFQPGQQSQAGGQLPSPINLSFLPQMGAQSQEPGLTPSEQTET